MQEENESCPGVVADCNGLEKDHIPEAVHQNETHADGAWKRKKVSTDANQVTRR